MTEHEDIKAQLRRLGSIESSQLFSQRHILNAAADYIDKLEKKNRLLRTDYMQLHDGKIRKISEHETLERIKKLCEAHAEGVRLGVPSVLWGKGAVAKEILAIINGEIENETLTGGISSE